MQPNIVFPQELLEEIESYAEAKGITVREFILWALGEKIGELRQRLGVKNLFLTIPHPISRDPGNINNNQEPYDPKPLLKAAEITKYLKISRSATYKLMRSGDIPVVKFGKSIRVRIEDLDKFIIDSKT